MFVGSLQSLVGSRLKLHELGMFAGILRMGILRMLDKMHDS